MSDSILDAWEGLSLGDSPGSVAPAGIRRRGVPADDKGISWRSSSDCLPKSRHRRCRSQRCCRNTSGAYESAYACVHTCPQRRQRLRLNTSPPPPYANTSAVPPLLVLAEKAATPAGALPSLSRLPNPWRYKIGFSPEGGVEESLHLVRQQEESGGVRQINDKVNRSIAYRD